MFETVNEYLNKLHNADSYVELEKYKQIQLVFTAEELLKDYFPSVELTDRAVALQVLYTLEGEDEEYSKLKRHGVKSFSTKGVSVTFEGAGISPDVINLLTPKKAYVGRLI